MDSLNVYTITFIEYNKEKRLDVIAKTPEAACVDLQRHLRRSRDPVEIVELTKISKNAIYFKTPKRS